jgi:hypothetical protein
MTDPTYAVQAVAWAMVWAAGGLTARDLLARAETKRRREQVSR